MIYFLSLIDNYGPMADFAGAWLRPKSRVHILPYEDLPPARLLPDGTYVFADVDQLPPDLQKRATALWDALAARGDRIRLLNHPAKAVRRFDLLRTRHDRGANRFNAYRLDEPLESLRYPVFLRPLHSHAGACTNLLHHREELDRALAEVRKLDSAVHEYLIVEFLDTSDALGRFRKYEALCVGGTVYAQEMMCKSTWEVKTGGEFKDELVEEERAFQRQNPYRTEIEAIFREASIDYGRMDFALLNGQVQVWEINTNPHVVSPPHLFHPSELPQREWFAEQVNTALAAIDDKSPPEPPMYFRIFRWWQTFCRPGIHMRYSVFWQRLRQVKAKLTQR